MNLSEMLARPGVTCEPFPEAGEPCVAVRIGGASVEEHAQLARQINDALKIHETGEMAWLRHYLSARNVWIMVRPKRGTADLAATEARVRPVVDRFRSQ